MRVGAGTSENHEMEEYQVPKRRVRSRVLLDDGRILDCDVFTAVSSPDGRPQTVMERLNEPDDEFLPVACGEDRFLLNKSGIVTVQTTEPEELKGLDPKAGRQVPVRLSLTGGISLLGRFHIVMPPEQSRVIDFLNRSPRFLPMLGEDKVTLVQRSYIVAVRSQV